MSTRREGLLWLGLLLMMVLPGAAAGQGTVRVDLSTTTIVFPQPGAADFAAGVIEHAGVVVSVTSRPPSGQWELRLRAPGATMGNGKPVSDLQWRLAGSAGWHPLTGMDEAVIQGAGDQDVTILFRMLLDWTRDGPGVYATDIDFTAIRL